MKTSMFNYSFQTDDGGLYLYNTYTGKNSICLVKGDEKKKVLDWLENPPVAANDATFEKLKADGFFVEDDVDEKRRREDLMMRFLSEPELDLTVHTTKQCNFRCQYCCLDFESKPMQSDVQKGIINHVRKNIGMYNSVTISWFGGEPLLEMGVIENISKPIIEICKRAKRMYFGAVTTNGYLLTDSNVKKLLENQVYSFTVTIDGLKDLHDSQRFLRDGSGTFDRIISNLLNIKNNYKSRAIHVNIRSNITSDILNRIDEYYDFFNDLFGDDDRFTMFVKPVGDWGGERVKKIADKLISENEIALVYQKLAQKKGKLKFLANTSDLMVGGVSCPARKRFKYTIGVEGGITKCDDPDTYYAIGQIDVNGNMNIDVDKNMKWITHRTILSETCDNCFYSCNCFGTYCPKWTVSNHDKAACALHLEELNRLIELYATMEGCPVIE